MQTVLVPTAVQRIRTFLSDRARIKVRPWAGAQDTVDALHAALLSRKHDDEFWRDLESMLATMKNDSDRRREAGAAAVDNEPLDDGQRCAVLAEVRAALDSRQTGHGAFRSLARSLSLPAAALWMLLGSIASAGCSAEPNPPGVPGTGGTVQVPGTGGQTGGPYDAAHIDLALPPPPPPCDAGSVTIEDMLSQCGYTDAERSVVNACVSRLNDSWRDGIAAQIACGDRWPGCFCLQQTICSDTDRLSEEYDPESMACAIPIYVGVRFV